MKNFMLACIEINVTAGSACLNAGSAFVFGVKKRLASFFININKTITYEKQ